MPPDGVAVPSGEALGEGSGVPDASAGSGEVVASGEDDGWDVPSPAVGGGAVASPAEGVGAAVESAVDVGDGSAVEIDPSAPSPVAVVEDPAAAPSTGGASSMIATISL